MRIGVWIETSSTVTRAGFESLLEDAGNVDLCASISQADVILREEMHDRQDAPELILPIVLPTVVLSDDAFTSRMLQLGVRAVLPRDAPPEQIIAALHAAAAGLIAVTAESGALVLSEEISNGNGSDQNVETLTPRELDALEMLAEGLSNKQIAGRLGISDHTAKFHVNSILAKFRAGTRTEAVMRGIRLGLVKV